MIANTITNTITERLAPELRHFLAALALLISEQVSEDALKALAAAPPCQAMPFANLLAECRRRCFLEALPEARKKRTFATVRHYIITKLGRGIAEAALRGEDHATELRLGAALLQYYRGTEAQAEALDIEAGLPNIFGIMAWAESTSRLPDRDLIRFIRQMRDALLPSGHWELGTSWLRYGEEAAAQLWLFRSHGELSATRAELLTAMGYTRSALGLLDIAEHAFRESSAQAESDLAEGLADEVTMRASLNYDALQQRWLTHLRVAARLTMLPAAAEPAALDALDALGDEVEAALAWLRETGAVEEANTRIASLLACTLAMDVIQLRLLRCDASMRTGDRVTAERHLRSARLRLGQVRSQIDGTQSPNVGTPEMRAHLERLEGGMSRRFALHGPGILRMAWRMAGRRHLARGLESTTVHGLEEALLLIESAELRLSGVYARRVLGPKRLSRHWHWLQSARRQLLLANADAAALGALPTQFATLLALVDVTARLAALSGRAPTSGEVSTYVQSATAIAERLHDELPTLLAQVRALPAWAVAPTTSAVRTHLAHVAS